MRGDISRLKWLAVVAAVAALSAGVLAGGCRRVELPGAEASADELWEEGLSALAEGRAELAAERFGESLAAGGEHDGVRAREAVLKLALAGRADLAGVVLADRAGEESQRLAEAAGLLAGGAGDNPYLLPAIAEALRLDGRKPDCVVMRRGALLFRPGDLAGVMNYWQSWVRFREIEANGSEAGDAIRVMVLWRISEGLGVAGEAAEARAELSGMGLVRHGSVGESGEGWQLVHLGSWRLDEAGPVEDMFGSMGEWAGPGELVFGAWQGDFFDVLAMRGRLEGGGFVVEDSSDEAMVGALTGCLSDVTLFPGRVVPRDATERERILALAEHLGLAEDLGADGAALVLTEGTGEDSGRGWLGDAGGYVRYFLAGE